MNGPLSGLKVLDIATIVAAPMAATLLADYGAEVIKLELPSGDTLRGLPPMKDGKSLWWKVANRNKQCITLDLRKPEGVKLFKQLLPRFDVLVENFRTGTLDGWGLSREVLWEANPRLVILRTTGFGQTGPYRRRTGFARIFEAMGGLTYLNGESNGEPLHPGFPLGDQIGGLFGALGVLAALWKRAREPESPGEEIDLALSEASMRLMEFVPIEYDQLGVVHQRSGNMNQYSAPSGVFRTRDGCWVTLAGSTGPSFVSNCRAIGRPELAEDPRFATNVQRVAHFSELNQIFSDWCGQHTQQKVLESFERVQGTLGPVYSVDQIFADPQVQAREAITSVQDDDFGRVRMQNVVPVFANDPGKVRFTGGSLGQHNAEVYGGWLSLSEDEQARLRKAGII